MNSETKTKRNEVLLAIIGLIGILATAVFSNWDKIFPEENIVQAKYSGYMPTDNYETELRHFFNVSGTRQAIDTMQKQLVQNFKLQLSAENPDDSEKIQIIMGIALEESITLDEIIPSMLPTYKNHIDLKELQELNKFYSTKIMQDMNKKMPLLAQEAAPIQVKLFNKFQERFFKRVKTELD